MALNKTGLITLGMVRTELGLSGPISLDQKEVRALAGIPEGQWISLNLLRGLADSTNKITPAISGGATGYYEGAYGHIDPLYPDYQQDLDCSVKQFISLESHTVRLELKDADSEAFEAFHCYYRLPLLDETKRYFTRVSYPRQSSGDLGSVQLYHTIDDHLDSALYMRDKAINGRATYPVDLVVEHASYVRLTSGFRMSSYANYYIDDDPVELPLFKLSAFLVLQRQAYSELSFSYVSAVDGISFTENSSEDVVLNLNPRQFESEMGGGAANAILLVSLSSSTDGGRVEFARIPITLKINVTSRPTGGDSSSSRSDPSDDYYT